MVGVLVVIRIKPGKDIKMFSFWNMVSWTKLDQAESKREVEKSKGHSSLGGYPDLLDVFENYRFWIKVSKRYSNTLLTWRQRSNYEFKLQIGDKKWLKLSDWKFIRTTLNIYRWCLAVSHTHHTTLFLTPKVNIDIDTYLCSGTLFVTGLCIWMMYSKKSSLGRRQDINHKHKETSWNYTDIMLEIKFLLETFPCSNV